MTSPLPTVRLKKALERSIRAGHPWIYRDALRSFDVAPGQVLTVLDRSGRFLARGLAERGAIAVRIFTTDDEPLDAHLFSTRIQQALDLRCRLELGDTTALRLLHGEGDRLPGVVLDRYEACAVLKLDGEAIAVWTDRLARVLREPLHQMGVNTLLLRQGRGEAKKLCALWGQIPKTGLEVREHGMRMEVDLHRGQKTGLFLDHRDSRRRVRELASGLKVLNLYGYNGGFSVAAGLGGAQQVTTVDLAKPAIQAARRNWLLNGLGPDRHRAVAQDVRAFLDQDGGRYQLIIADPPSFAPRKAALTKALGAYRALHAASLAHLDNRGLYLAASCSSHVDMRCFERTLADAAQSARVQLQVIRRWGAAADHPLQPGFKEGNYLSVVLARRGR